MISRLSVDVGIRERLLYETMQFYQYFPILPTSAKLGWSHYRVLLGVPAQAERRFYLQETSRTGWSVRELEAEVKAGAFDLSGGKSEAVESPPKRPCRAALPALRGELFAYRLIATPAEGGPSGLRLDLGFGIHLSRPLNGLAAPRQGLLVRSRKTVSGSYEFAEAQDRRAAFYTYRARVLSVVDGDTLWLDIDCGFGVWTRQKVRLRGIDTPELPTAEGRRAKDFVAGALNGLPFVAVTTTKPDKYDRYLADLFYLKEAKNPEVVVEEGIFLNRALMDAGLAKRM